MSLNITYWTVPNEIIFMDDINFANKLIKIFLNWHFKIYNERYTYNFPKTNNITKNSEDKKIDLKNLSTIINKIKNFDILKHLKYTKKKYSYQDSVIINIGLDNKIVTIYLIIGFININALEN